MSSFPDRIEAALSDMFLSSRTYQAGGEMKKTHVAEEEALKRAMKIIYPRKKP